jgi:hypothetical protein
MVRKLRIMSSCDHPGQTVDIEEAKDWNFFDPTALVVVENHLIYSYEELLEIASTDGLKNKEILDVHLMITCTGG